MKGLYQLCSLGEVRKYVIQQTVKLISFPRSRLICNMVTVLSCNIHVMYIDADYLMTKEVLTYL